MDLTLQFRGSSNQRIIDVPKSLATGEVVIWDKLVKWRMASTDVPSFLI